MSTFKKFQPRTEILPDSQKEVWSLLKPAAKMGFTLYGGTAIALQLGHRQSVDFDLFTDSKLNESAILRKMPFLKRAQVIQASENTLTMAYPVDKEQVKISMFGGIAFGRVGAPLIANGNELPVASLDDLMATKLKVILQRAEKKDYMDIAEMIRSGVSLEKGVGSASSMFGKTFPPMDCLAALTYFKDGDLETLSKKDMETLIRQSSKVTEIRPQRIISKALGVGGLEI
ncbi:MULTISPECIES: nucleotidyl transferase AbiEii/AbiGii toxin family protein [Acidithiobacillus]|uniref:Nucleotidyl transferase AbiEii/AbiGii toxin family protein n=1 Tax=Acidithiobacillus ferrivorans TaxID=160808 RepID=A0A7T4WC92_9PROT|nr:nucleotidyl transferase AbiEii/AbiGii toxin family protein [Acidithiobacillus ferrivorans]QQD71954.1 nucleotidyl transferase AbiEii/AbiGii toxin family protein [Acidithiobacillus ferrivorans]